jgi:amino acid permease
MKKHYYFVIPIIIMVYLIYLIISETYKNYTENYKIENAKEANKETRNINSEIKNKIEYVATNAYKVKELKELGNALP